MADASPPHLPLPSLQPGIEAVVADVRADAAAYLDEVGIVAGTLISVERVIPLGGPVIVHLGTARAALGRRTASAVLVARPVTASRGVSVARGSRPGRIGTHPGEAS